MDYLIETLSKSSDFAKALAISAGGLIGVFATLGLFYLMIWAANKLNKKD
jgi:cell division protein FtsW (lipid II flippase)